MTEKQYCFKCNKCLTDKNGMSVTAICFSLNTSTLIGEEACFASDFQQHLMGEYDAKVTYNFCSECVIDALLGAP